jgi:small subunit ribosomal protein S15
MKMAKLHSKKRGKSGSKRPIIKAAPEWVDYAAHEVEELVLKLFKEGNNPTTIGHLLRDQHGVPLVKNITGKTISQIIEGSGKKIEYPDDLLWLIKKAVKVSNHLKANKSDKHNTTKLIHIESKIKRLVKYYRRTGRLPATWVYTREQAALLVK